MFVHISDRLKISTSHCYLDALAFMFYWLDISSGVRVWVLLLRCPCPDALVCVCMSRCLYLGARIRVLMLRRLHFRVFMFRCSDWVFVFGCLRSDVRVHFVPSCDLMSCDRAYIYRIPVARAEQNSI